jgi:hypothetical protein
MLSLLMQFLSFSSANVKVLKKNLTNNNDNIIDTTCSYIFFLLKKISFNFKLLQIILYKKLSQDERKNRRMKVKHIYLTLSVNG